MFCSTCGNPLSESLVFCNKCGKRVKDAPQNEPGGPSEASTNFLIAAMLGIPIAGIGIVIGLISVMKKELDFPNDVILTMAFMGFALLIFAEFGFLYLLVSRTKFRKAKDQDHPPRQLSEAQTKTLAEAQFQNMAAPPASVTESTTRSFDPVYREK
jgi:hypothetical protein